MIGRNAVLFSHAPITLEVVAVDRLRDGADGRHDRPRPERHQARARVLDGLAARLHVPGDGRRRVRRRHLPSLHARVLQGAAVPRIGRGDSRAARRAGHAPHGRPEEGAADHVLDVPDRHARDRRRPAPRRASSRRTRSSGRRSRSGHTMLWALARRHRVPDGDLHVPAAVPGVLRRAPSGAARGHGSRHARRTHAHGASARTRTATAAHLHDAPPAMAIALVVLAIGSVVAGYVGVPNALVPAATGSRRSSSRASARPAARRGAGGAAAAGAQSTTPRPSWR